MVCNACNKQVPDGSATCPYCSAPLGNAAPPPQAAYPPPPGPAPTMVMRSLKTGTDKLCGALFIIFGLGLLAYVGLFLVDALPLITDMFTALSTSGFGYLFANDVARYTLLPLLLQCIALVLWCAGGLFLLFAGIFCFTSGRGRSPATTSLTLMLFAILFEIIALVVTGITMNALSPGSADYPGMILSALPFWILWVLAILVVVVMLPLKKSAKRKAGRNITVPVNQQTIYVTQAPPAAPQPATQPAPAAQAAPPQQPAAPFTPPVQNTAVPPQAPGNVPPQPQAAPFAPPAQNTAVPPQAQGTMPPQQPAAPFTPPAQSTAVPPQAQGTMPPQPQAAPFTPPAQSTAVPPQAQGTVPPQPQAGQPQKPQ